MVISKSTLTTLCLVIFWLSPTHGFATLDLAVIVQASDTVFFGQWILIHYFLKSTLTSLDHLGFCDVQVAMITYGSTAKLNWNFARKETSGVDAIRKAIDNMEQVPGDPKTFEDGLNLASESVFRGNRNRPDVPDATLFITWSDVPSEGLKEAADQLKSLSTVFVVAITTNVNLDQLRVIATDEDKILAMNDYFGIKNALSAMKMERSICPNLECRRNHLVERLAEDELYFEVKSSKPEKTVNMKRLTTDSGLKMDKGEGLTVRGLRPFHMKYFCISVKFVEKFTVTGLSKKRNLNFDVEVSVPSIDQDEWSYQCVKLQHPQRSKRLEKFEVTFTSETDFYLRKFFMHGCVPI